MTSTPRERLAGCTALVLLIGSCAAPDTDEPRPAPPLQPEPPISVQTDGTAADAAVTHASGPEPPAQRGDWPFRDRADFATRLRAMGRWLETPRFTLLSLQVWSWQASQLGLRYDMPKWLYGGSPSADIGFGYEVRFRDASEDGWHLRNWSLDVNAPGLEPRDRVGMQISSSDPQVACIDPEGFLGVLPHGCELASKVLVVSPGNGRLVVVDMRPDGQVQVLPYTFVRESGERDGEHWPYGAQEAFASRLREVGASLADAASDDDVLRVWAARAPELGLRVYESTGTVEVADGMVIAPADGTSEGWIVREQSPGTPANLTPGTESAHFIAAKVPSVMLVYPGECSLDPPMRHLNGTVLAVAPGNGRLVVIEMKPDGLVSILPQAFD